MPWSSIAFHRTRGDEIESIHVHSPWNELMSFSSRDRVPTISWDVRERGNNLTGRESSNASHVALRCIWCSTKLCYRAMFDR